MNNNLSLIGSEIINGNNILPITPSRTEEKIITKSYNIVNTPLKDYTPKNNNNYKEKKASITKKGYSLDLSKIMYNDGYILADAVNSNPGFGLWAIKGSSKSNTDSNKKKISKTISNDKILIKENKALINNGINNNRYDTKRTNSKSINISSINNINNTFKNDITNTKIDKSLTISNNINETNNIEINEKKKQNKKYIEQITMKCKDLEQKCFNMMSNYQEKENLCKNAIKAKNEYEKILQENIEETKIIKEEHQKLSSDNSKLKNVYKNTKNEIDRLLNVMRTDNNTINNIKVEFEDRLKMEENERARLSNVLSINEKEIESLRQALYGIEDNKSNDIKNLNNLNKNNNI